MTIFSLRNLLPFAIETPMGRINAAAVIEGGRAGQRALRVFGRYAIVYILEGGGSYRGAGDNSRKVSAGDCLFLFPDIPHSYGPGRGEHWTEVYVVFEGPVFDLWRAAGVLGQERPVARVEPVDHWLQRIESVISPNDGSSDETTIARFLALLTEIAQRARQSGSTAGRDAWYEAAQRALGTELGAELSMHELASEAGMSYETFRKRFTARSGVSPGRYRSQKRIDAAREILTRTDLSIKQVAAYLGFSNEFNFSRRFREIAGVSPSEYRRSGA